MPIGHLTHFWAFPTFMIDFLLKNCGYQNKMREGDCQVFLVLLNGIEHWITKLIKMFITINSV